MKIFKQLFIALIVITGLISVNSYAGKDDKVIVCHKTESKNGEHKIVVLYVSEKAASAHKELHGDEIDVLSCPLTPPNSLPV
jgi:hypothetical protein